MTAYVCGCGCGALLMAPGDRRDGFLIGHRPTPRQFALRQVRLVVALALPLTIMAVAWLVQRSGAVVAVVGLLTAAGSVDAFYAGTLGWRLDLMHWFTGQDKAPDWWAAWASVGGWIVIAIGVFLAVVPGF